MCPFLDTCEDPAQMGGGCDCDGADDFGVDPVDDFDTNEDDYEDFDINEDDFEKSFADI